MVQEVVIVLLLALLPKVHFCRGVRAGVRLGMDLPWKVAGVELGVGLPWKAQDDL